jgi:hypothetical protein
LGFSHSSGTSGAPAGGVHSEGLEPWGQALHAPAAPLLTWRLIIRSRATLPITTAADIVIVSHISTSHLTQAQEEAALVD